MAFKLTKEQLNRWDDLVKNARDERNSLQAALEQFNKAIDEARTALQTYVDDYNSTLIDLKEFIGEVASDWRGEFDDKSETWQEGDKGQEVSELIDGFESWEPGEFALDDWEGQEPPSDDDIQTFEDLKPE